MLENNKKSYWADSINVFVRMSGWIIGPILVGIFLGKWFDSKFDTAPIIFITMMIFSFLLSTFGIVREASRYMKKIEKDIKEKKEEYERSNTNKSTN